MMQNPWAGFTVGFTWAQHLAAGYHGGTDYVAGPGVVVTSPADGMARAVADGTNAVEVTLDNGWVVGLRENRDLLGSYPRRVTQGEALALTGLVRGGLSGARWPHIDITVNGIRAEFEPYLTPTTTTAGSSSTPIPGDDMYEQADRDRDTETNRLIKQIDLTTQDIQKRLIDVANGTVLFPGATYNAFTALANENATQLAALTDIQKRLPAAP